MTQDISYPCRSAFFLRLITRRKKLKIVSKKIKLKILKK